MLDDKSTRLAAYLQSKKCGPGSLVGICMSRTVEMVTALLAVLKTGAAYVPLDPSFPQDRLDFMVQDAAIATVLSDETAKSSVPRREVSVISVDGEREAIASSRYSFNPVIVPPDSAAYILYTSGSTGKPKGVCITHGSVVNFLTSMAIKPGFSDHDVVCGVTTLSFDIAVLELILPLTVGGRVEIMSRDIAADGNRLKKRLAAQDITVMQATPATWRLLIASGWQGNTTLKALCGGEALSPELAQALLERCGELWNMYGPTETTVWSSCARIVDTKECITLGNPIANTAFYIANESGMPLPPMAPGELLIGGKGLSTGYLNRPDLTHKNFLPNAIYPEHGPLMYRTGDLARLRPDGKLEYLRRIDTQVKVRGFRIELGEIETVAMRHPALKQCVAIVTGAGDDVRLVLYYVLNEGHTVTLTDLRKRLRADLPEYMIPQYVIRMEELPLTPNNKIDRKRLPPPADSSVAADDTYIAPRTKTEKIIAAVWSELLKTDHISIHSNFFELGGHSLLSMTCVDRINKETGFQINPRMILTDSLEQIASQCVNIDGLPVSHPAVEISNPENTIQPLYFGDSKSPLFGVYHPSLHSKNRDYGILICPPITHEYVRAHRSLRQLATALASKGFPVLRFDYFGVGDSAGESGEGGVARWTKDIRIAMEELMALSNKNSICLIGLRMGAALALQALSEKTSCKRLILWDPIISGLQMFKELADLHVTAYSTKVSKRSTELIGFPYPAQLQEELRGLDLLQARPTGLENVVLLVPGNGPQYSLLQQHLAQSTPSCTTMHFSDSTDWESPSAFDQMLIATNAIETIITVLTEEKQ
jgi:amino acid adenylation domain-containing protein